VSPAINPSLPIPGQPNATEEPKIVTALSQIVAAVNAVDSSNIVDGTIAPDDLQSALLDKLGASSASVVRRGQSSIVTQETRTNAAYGLMATPDRVSSLVLQTNGLIVIALQAMMSETTTVGTARAAIFIGANQLKVAASAGPVVQETAAKAATIGTFNPVFTTAQGLTVQDSATVYPGDASTGQLVGFSIAGQTGICYVFAAAGTYDISVQYKTVSTGSVVVSNRKLWAWTVGF
jgi:hypothetical protein